MDWSAKIFSYCERGTDPGFWAEPFNAISNGAFVIASLVALVVWRRLPVVRRGWAELGLIALVAVIGAGSFAFHTMATRWSVIADTAPIGVFMFVYTGYALRRFLQWPWWAVALGVAGFGVALQAAFNVSCPVALRGIVAGSRCLNGSMGYLPAFAMLGGVGLVAALRGNRSAGLLIAATMIFAVSIAVRSADLEVCAATQVLGRVRGTHAIWHSLNAVMLGMLLLAALWHGGAGVGQAHCAGTRGAS